MSNRRIYQQTDGRRRIQRLSALCSSYVTLPRTELSFSFLPSVCPLSPAGVYASPLSPLHPSI